MTVNWRRSTPGHPHSFIDESLAQRYRLKKLDNSSREVALATAQVSIHTKGVYLLRGSTRRTSIEVEVWAVAGLSHPIILGEDFLTNKGTIPGRRLRLV